MEPLRVDVLGPLRVLVDGHPVDVRGQKRRAVLVLLALAEGRTVPVDRLVDALWPGDVPDSGRQAVHSHVFRLRGDLGPASARLQTRPDGYRLELPADGLDVARARTLLATARAGLDRDPAHVYALVREAHALWRGPALADLTDIAPIAAALESHAQLRHDVTDALIAAGIVAGQPDQVAGLAAEALAADPLREPAVLLLMRALAATGRASEALRIGRDYRNRLADEAGLDPSPALDDLVRDIAAGQAPVRPETPTRPATRLVGRAEEVAALHRLLATERLVTVAGPGGVGKTRVALEVSEQRRATIVLQLAPVTDPTGIPHALAAALGLKVDHGDVLASCLAVLSDHPGLLVVDNCEHLLDPVRATIGAILSACPALPILATSREPLGLAAECVFRLAPLPLPGSERDLRQVPSVEVFLDRAGRVRPGLPVTPADLRLVAHIVRRLDGMPLAIELAAGRLSTFSLADLHERLDRSLDLLGGRPSGEDRHRTLRATVEWSYRLLSDDEQRLFRHMSIFVDSVALDAVERLAAALGLTGDPGTLLARLVDASMIDVDFATGTRYHMLETLRAYGHDRLAVAGEDEAAAAHLLRWGVELTMWIGATMTTAHEPEADAVLRRELANLRAAWRLTRDREALDDAAAMIVALYDAVAYRDLIELRGWAGELADAAALAGHPRECVVLGVAAEAAYHHGDYARAERLARAGLDRASVDGEAWYCLAALSVVALARGEHAAAIEHSLAAAAIAARPRENLDIAALAALYSGDPDRARALHEEGLAGLVSPTLLSFSAYVAGEIDSLTGHGAEAEQHYQRAIELARGSGATFVVEVATVGLLALRAGTGRMHDALDGYREVVDYFARTGNWTHQWTTLRNLADLLRRLGDEEPATLIDAAADHAPDAPAVNGARPAASTAPPILARAAVLDVARRAIERNLTTARRTPPR
jgi:predicted ATPase/DNA-binding SARP family transcriptional activator